MTTPGMTIDQLKAELERVQADNKALIKLASHDMRSPLNKLYALVNLLKMTDDPLSEEQLGYLDNMELVLSEGLQQMRNLVDLRAIEQDQLQLNLEKLDLAALLTRIVREYTPVAARTGIKIATKLEPVITISDRLLLARILDQLLTNAIKFSPAKAEIRVLLQSTADKFTITVIDGGYGIAEEEQAELFKKFKVLSSRPTGGETNRGLGLYLARKNVEKLRGSIHYRNDQASAFIIAMPLTSLA